MFSYFCQRADQNDLRLSCISAMQVSWRMHNELLTRHKRQGGTNFKQLMIQSTHLNRNIIQSPRHLLGRTQGLIDMNQVCYRININYLGGGGINKAFRTSRSFFLERLEGLYGCQLRMTAERVIRLCCKFHDSKVLKLQRKVIKDQFQQVHRW